MMLLCVAHLPTFEEHTNNSSTVDSNDEFTCIILLLGGIAIPIFPVKQKQALKIQLTAMAWSCYRNTSLTLYILILFLRHSPAVTQM